MCRPGDQLHAASAARRCRLHLAVESAAVSVFMEDRTGACGRLHGRRKAERGHADDGVFACRSCASRRACRRGVLNIVHGLGPKVGAAIVAHQDVKAISFTGGTKTGEEIARTSRLRCSRNCRSSSAAKIRISSSPTAITTRCSRRRSVRHSQIKARSACAARGYLSSGRCMSNSKATLSHGFRRLKVGDPLEPRHRCRCDRVETAFRQDNVVHRSCARQKADDLDRRRTVTARRPLRRRMVYRADRDRGTCRTTAERIRKRSSARSSTIMPFDTEDEVLGYANSVRYGLSSTVWTEIFRVPIASRQRSNPASSGSTAGCSATSRTPFGGVKIAASAAKAALRP